jgi:hypothetical protein
MCTTVSISLSRIVSPQTGHSFVAGMVLVPVVERVVLKLASAPRLDKRVERLLSLAGSS